MQVIAGLTDPLLLHELLDYYNWDDGFDVPFAIANNLTCELGTAVRLFWLADGGSWFQMTERERARAADHDLFCSHLFSQITAGSYPVATVSYVEELSKVAQNKYEKSGLPSLFWRPIGSTIQT